MIVLADGNKTGKTEYREKLWAFPTALVVFGLLIVYQLYRLAHSHSTTLVVLIMIDVAVCYLIWREWGFRREPPQVTAGGVDDDCASRP